MLTDACTRALSALWEAAFDLRSARVRARRNCDFDARPEASSAFPVWDGEQVPVDMIFDPEDVDGFLVPRRLGFVYRIE
jgi:hypothetical protein